LTADLYIDATGADARLLSAAGDAGWDDWGGWLPCDSLTVNAVGPVADLPLLDRVTATGNGWTLETAHPGSGVRARVFARELPGAPDQQELPAPVRFRAGRRRRAWIGNVVAIGEAFMTAEPLEAVPLHIVHTQVDRLIASLPDRDFSEVETAHYDRETIEEADRLRDFLILHYAVADRPEPFWRAVTGVPLPSLLAETLKLFRERGRLPIRDGESFARDSWLAVLIGQGVIPRRHDVLAELDDARSIRVAMDHLATGIMAVVEAAPSHAMFLQRFLAGQAR
jgi:tryptophan halogenase